jgi:CDP-diacylglycerol---glycerol-3-phosphate 3-phosphatidyltransferase
MIVRGAGLHLLRHGVPAPTRSQTHIRRFAALSASYASASAVPPHSLASVTTQLDRVCPRFEIDPSAVNILNSPAAFYETLKVFMALQF